MGHSAYAGRETVNQTFKNLDTSLPKLIDKTLKKVDKIVEARIRQVISAGSQQVEKVTPIIIRNAIEEVYKTQCRLLGNFAKKISVKQKGKFFD